MKLLIVLPYFPDIGILLGLRLLDLIVQPAKLLLRNAGEGELQCLRLEQHPHLLRIPRIFFRHPHDPVSKTRDIDQHIFTA